MSKAKASAIINTSAAAAVSSVDLNQFTAARLRMINDRGTTLVARNIGRVCSAQDSFDVLRALCYLVTPAYFGLQWPRENDATGASSDGDDGNNKIESLASLLHWLITDATILARAYE
jgi:hypothetical protein